MSETIDATASHLETDIGKFRERMHPDVATATVAEAVAKFRAKFESEGLTNVINVAPAQVLKDYERQVRGQYDEQLRSEAQRLQAELDATDAAMATTIATVAQLPHPIDTSAQTLGGEQARELRRMRVVMELDRAERQLSGKTLRHIVDVYEASSDIRDEAFVWFVERQAAAGWPDVERRPADDDVSSLQRLTRAVQTRQHARVERDHPEVLAAAVRLKALRSATLTSLFRHVLQDGRGVALVS